MNKNKKLWLKPIKPIIAKTIEKESKRLQENLDNAIIVEKYLELQYNLAKQNTKKYCKERNDYRFFMYGV